MPLFSGFFSRKNIRTAVRSLVGDTASGGALETLSDALSSALAGGGTPGALGIFKKRISWDDADIGTTGALVMPLLEGDRLIGISAQIITPFTSAGSASTEFWANAKTTGEQFLNNGTLDFTGSAGGTLLAPAEFVIDGQANIKVACNLVVWYDTTDETQGEVEITVLLGRAPVDLDA